MPGKIVQSSGGGGAGELTGFPLAWGCLPPGRREKAAGDAVFRCCRQDRGRSRGRGSQALRRDVDAAMRKETPDVMHLPRQGAVKDCARGPASALPAGTAGDGGHVPVHGALLVRLLPSRLRRESAVWDTFMPSGAVLSPEAWRQGAKNCRRQPFLASLQFAEMKVYLGR